MCDSWRVSPLCHLPSRVPSLRGRSGGATHWSGALDTMAAIQTRLRPASSPLPINGCNVILADFS